MQWDPEKKFTDVLQKTGCRMAAAAGSQSLFFIVQMSRKSLGDGRVEIVGIRGGLDVIGAVAIDQLEAAFRSAGEAADHWIGNIVHTLFFFQIDHLKNSMSRKCGNTPEKIEHTTGADQ